MQLVIFLVEIIAIYFWLEYDNLKMKFASIEEPKIHYYAYDSIDMRGEATLILDKIATSQKLSIWQQSSLRDEMLSHFPNLQEMSQSLNNGIIDNGQFKEKFIGYLEYIHGEYLSGGLSTDEYREAIENPNPSLPAF
jgi:hypothetical protein